MKNNNTPTDYNNLPLKMQKGLLEPASKIKGENDSSEQLVSILYCLL